MLGGHTVHPSFTPSISNTGTVIHPSMPSVRPPVIESLFLLAIAMGCCVHNTLTRTEEV